MMDLQFSHQGLRTQEVHEATGKKMVAPLPLGGSRAARRGGNGYVFLDDFVPKKTQNAKNEHFWQALGRLVPVTEKKKFP